MLPPNYEPFSVEELTRINRFKFKYSNTLLLKNLLNQQVQLTNRQPTVKFETWRALHITYDHGQQAQHDYSHYNELNSSIATHLWTDREEATARTKLHPRARKVQLQQIPQQQVRSTKAGLKELGHHLDQDFFYTMATMQPRNPTSWTTKSSTTTPPTSTTTSTPTAMHHCQPLGNYTTGVHRPLPAARAHHNPSLKGACETYFTKSIPYDSLHVKPEPSTILSVRLYVRSLYVQLEAVCVLRINGIGC
eukprot:5030810-Amphidinium_carterae.1